jgi:hypothetical protein
MIFHRRGVIDQETFGCAGDCGNQESLSHLFFECPVFGTTFVSGLANLEQFECLMGSGRVCSMRSE